MDPEQLSQEITNAINLMVSDGDINLDPISSVTIERPKNRVHGDWATNVAMQYAKKAGMNPREFATAIVGRIEKIPGVVSADIAGPGFINITLDSQSSGAIVTKILGEGSDYGHNDSLVGQSINMEFVSANPTGPLHIGHTRWAALGDSIARVLRASGAKVTNEYYINDAGSQMDVFAQSIITQLEGKPVQSGQYPGAYIKQLGQKVLEKFPHVKQRDEQGNITWDVETIKDQAYQFQMQEIKDTLHDFNVEFDVYFSERDLHAGSPSPIDAALEQLHESGNAYIQDDALWAKTTEFGDDKDRVLTRSNGEKTYFAADVAYYKSKKDRGFSDIIYLLGADHHGYTGRLEAIREILSPPVDSTNNESQKTQGIDKDREKLEILIGQLVNIDGMKLSKRAGNIIELSQAIEDIGADALRYSLARYPATSPLSLNPQEMTQQTQSNPVFYVQYANARTHAIARNARAIGLSLEKGVDPSLLTDSTEENLLAELAQFPSVVASAAQLREPHRIARYLETLSGAFHRWYDACRIIPSAEEEIKDINIARLALNSAVGQVLHNGLYLLGVHAPERM